MLSTTSTRQNARGNNVTSRGNHDRTRLKVTWLVTRYAGSARQWTYRLYSVTTTNATQHDRITVVVVTRPSTASLLFRRRAGSESRAATNDDSSESVDTWTSVLRVAQQRA